MAIFASVHDKTTGIRAAVFWCLPLVLGGLGCGPHSGDPKAVPGHARIEPSPVSEGATCAPAGAIVDERFHAVDMNSEASVMASAGQPIFICAPIRRAMSGRVVDDATRAPVQGAVTTVESWRARPPIAGLRPGRRLLQVIEARTGAQGRWEVPSSSIWMRGFLAADGLPFVLSSYCVRADGYAPFVYDPWNSNAPRKDDAISEIGLRATAGVDQKPDASLSKCGLPLGPPL